MPKKLASQHITFGWDRESDERSLKAFIQRFGQEDLLETIIPRLKDHDITCVVDIMSGLLHKHLSEKEYHNLFLNEDK